MVSSRIYTGMAKEKKVKVKKVKKGKGKGKMPWTGQLVMISGILLSLAFLQSTILICGGNAADTGGSSGRSYG